MSKIILPNESNKATLTIRQFGAAIFLTIAVASCSSPPQPLAIRMYNPKTNQTLYCTARSNSNDHAPILGNAVEACARQLEANGFVRDN